MQLTTRVPGASNAAKAFYLLLLMQLFIPWNPSPDFLSFGIFSIKYYGVLWGASLMAVFFINRYLFIQLGRSDEKVTLGIQYIFIGGLIGARLAHILFYSLDYYLQNPADIIAVWKGGLASHGGVVGGLIGLYLFCRNHKEFGFFWTLDIAIISVPVLAALIRLGNLMNSELCGRPTNVPWGFVFENSPEVSNALPRHPVVLYESIAYFIIQLIMFALFKKYKQNKPGLYLATFLISVFTTRFLLEFFKEPDGAVFFNAISKTQMLNLPFIIAGLVIAYLAATKKLKYEEPAAGLG